MDLFLFVCILDFGISIFGALFFRVALLEEIFDPLSPPRRFLLTYSWPFKHILTSGISA
jgi:hypothetical protein